MDGTLRMTDKFEKKETNHVWLQVEADRDEELRWMQDQLADALGPDYQIIVTSDRVDLMSASEARNAIGKLLAAAGMNLDQSIAEQVGDVTTDEE